MWVPSPKVSWVSLATILVTHAGTLRRSWSTPTTTSRKSRKSLTLAGQSEAVSIIETLVRRLPAVHGECVSLPFIQRRSMDVQVTFRRKKLISALQVLLVASSLTRMKVFRHAQYMTVSSRTLSWLELMCESVLWSPQPQTQTDGNTPFRDHGWYY